MKESKERPWQPDSPPKKLFRREVDGQPQTPEDPILDQFLSDLPDFPVASNFTARVLQAIEASENKETGRRRDPLPSLFRIFFRFIPRISLVLLLSFTTWSAFQQHLRFEQQSLADGTAKVSGIFSQKLGSVTTVELLENFDAIQLLSSS